MDSAIQQAERIIEDYYKPDNRSFHSEDHSKCKVLTKEEAKSVGYSALMYIRSRNVEGRGVFVAGRYYTGDIVKPKEPECFEFALVLDGYTAVIFKFANKEVIHLCSEVIFKPPERVSVIIPTTNPETGKIILRPPIILYKDTNITSSYPINIRSTPTGDECIYVELPYKCVENLKDSLK